MSLHNLSHFQGSDLRALFDRQVVRQPGHLDDLVVDSEHPGKVLSANLHCLLGGTCFPGVAQEGAVQLAPLKLDVIFLQEGMRLLRGRGVGALGDDLEEVLHLAAELLDGAAQLASHLQAKLLLGVQSTAPGHRASLAGHRALRAKQPGLQQRQGTAGSLQLGPQKQGLGHLHYWHWDHCCRLFRRQCCLLRSLGGHGLVARLGRRVQPLPLWSLRSRRRLP
mmetsp:Transcript_46633/g.84142  ORF Transcript_46633/g.84142 Transcript_46633/m.84142 type:complete len:222 (-) Transcript_46633:2965-3630(-)